MTDINDKASFVYEIQSALYILSREYADIESVIPDGIYGSETTVSVRSFQSHFRLPVSGKTDYPTWKAIFAEYEKIKELHAPSADICPFHTMKCEGKICFGDESSLVMIIQIMLRDISNLYPNFKNISVCGKYDEATRSAIYEFQHKNGLNEHGSVDKCTWNALAEQYNSENMCRF